MPRWRGTAAGRTAARTLCNLSLRTASGPEGSSAKQILTCAAGSPGRGGVRTLQSAFRTLRLPCVLQGSRAQVAAAALRRRHRPARRHRDAPQRHRRRAHRPVVRVRRPARRRQDDDRPHPRARAQLRARADAPTRAASATPASRSPQGRDIDVIEIDAATNTQVDKVRNIIIAGLGMRAGRGTATRSSSSTRCTGCRRQRSTRFSSRSRNRRRTSSS